MLQELLDDLGRAGVRLWVSDGQLRYDGPQAAMTPELLGRLRANRVQLLARFETGSRAPSGNGQGPGPIRLVRLGPAGAGPVLLVIPAVGTGPRTYQAWSRHASTEAEVVAVHLPGRENSLDEAPYTTVAPVAERLAALIPAEFPGRQWVVVGHSGGALIGREVVRRLPPGAATFLVAAAAVPPDQVPVDLDRDTDAELIAGMRDVGGLPRNSEHSPATLAAFLPTLRADLAVAASCRTDWSAAERISAPVLALYGRDDTTVTAEQSAEWRRWTRGRCEVREVPGDHFFPVRDGARTLAEVLEFVTAAH